MFKFFDLKQSLREVIRLAFPITTSFLAIGIMGVIDTIIVGNYNTDQLAYIGIANSIFILLFTFPIGLLQGVLIKSSQKYGARKFASTGKIYNEGRKYALLLSIVFTIIGINGRSILELLGQNPDMVENGGKVLNVFSFSIPFILIYANANFFLQSIKRPQVAMYAALVANVLNIAVNPVLVYGKFGFPELGAVGSATSTLIVRIFLALFMLYYIRRMKAKPKVNKHFGLDRSYPTWWSDSRNTRRLGYGVAIMSISANGSYAAVSTFAGWLGQQSMAVFVILINISSLVFMICFSISQATSIVVANAYGRRDKDGIICAACAGFLVMLTALLCLETALYNFPNQTIGIFTDDPVVLASVRGLIWFLMIEIMVDSLPLVIIGSLNGRNDVLYPTSFQAFAFLVVRISTCYLLTFTFGLGLKGLILGLMSGGATSFLLNISRFIYLIRRDRREGLR
mgnify:FL=1